MEQPPPTTMRVTGEVEAVAYRRSAAPSNGRDEGRDSPEAMDTGEVVASTRAVRHELKKGVAMVGTFLDPTRPSAAGAFAVLRGSTKRRSV